MARILLVDDEPDLLTTVGILLKSEGHEVTPVKDGLAAIKRLRSKDDFDLMMTDIRMAPMDGLDLIAMASHERPAMDIIVLSAYLDDETLGRAMGLGAAAYVDKPFSMEDVLHPVREVLLRRTHRGESTVADIH